jgi:hypothetical protein
MVDIQTVSIVVAAVGVLIAAVNSVITSRQANQQREMELKARRAQLTTQLYNDFRKPEYLLLLGKAIQMNWRDFDDFQTKYNPVENMDERMPYSMWSTYFDLMGVLLREGLIDIDLVNGFMPPMLAFWKKFEPYIFEYREREKIPQYFTGLEYLYNEFMKLQG